MFSNFRAIDCARGDVPSYFAGCLCSATFDELALPGPATTTLACIVTCFAVEGNITRRSPTVRMQSRAEAKIFATHALREVPNAKFALFYHNDDFGKDFVNGLRDVLGDRYSSIAQDRRFDAGHPSTPHQRSQTIATRTPSPCDTHSSSQQSDLLL